MWRAPEGAGGTGRPGCGARGRRRGLAGLRADVQAHVSTPGPTGVEGAGGSGGHGRASRSTTPSEARVWRSRGRPGPTAPGPPAEPQATSSIANYGCTAGVKGARGPGCGARGRRQGLAAVPEGGGRARAGLEIDHSEPQARVWRSRGRAAAHRHTQRPGPKAGPDGARNTSDATHNTHTTTRVRQRGGYRSTRPLSAHSATASSRLRPNDPQSWRRRRIHRNMPPTTAAPRPAPPIRPSKPVRARPFFGLVAGTSGAT